MTDKSFPSEKILESNLKYFEIHAAQRLTVFNFYIAISGTMLAAMAAISQGPSRYTLVGSILGLLLAVISFVFSKLDSRTSFLVKHAESIIKKIESEYLSAELSVFELEDSRTTEEQTKNKFPKKMYTYGQLFHTLFWIFGLTGMAGSLLMGLRAFDIVNWEEKRDKEKELMVLVPPVSPAVTNTPTEAEAISNSPNSCGPPSPSNNVRDVARQPDLPGQHQSRSER